MLLAAGWGALLWLCGRAHLLLRRASGGTRNHGSLELLWAAERPALPDRSAQPRGGVCRFRGRMQLRGARHVPVEAHMGEMRGWRVGRGRQRLLRPLKEASSVARNESREARNQTALNPPGWARCTRLAQVSTGDVQWAHAGGLQCARRRALLPILPRHAHVGVRANQDFPMAMHVLRSPIHPRAIPSATDR